MIALQTPHESAARFRSAMLSPDQEQFMVQPVDGRLRPIGDTVVVALGSANSVAVHPRDIFREAIRRNAVGVVIAHNHPSGDPTPSAEDKALTERVSMGAELLGINLIDHVIVTDGGYLSFAEGGLL